MKGTKEIGVTKLKQNNQIIIDPCIRSLHLRLKIVAMGASSSSCGSVGQSTTTVNISCGSVDSWPLVVTHFYSIFVEVCSN